MDLVRIAAEIAGNGARKMKGLTFLLVVAIAAFGLGMWRASVSYLRSHPASREGMPWLVPAIDARVDASSQALFEKRAQYVASFQGDLMQWKRELATKAAESTRRHGVISSKAWQRHLAVLQTHLDDLELNLLQLRTGPPEAWDQVRSQLDVKAKAFRKAIFQLQAE